MMSLVITGTYLIMILLGLFELYQTFKFYKWDKKLSKCLQLLQPYSLVDI